MPIPVGRSGNVDGEGGTADLGMRLAKVVREWGNDDVPIGWSMRVGLGSVRFEWWPISGSIPTFSGVLAGTSGPRDA